MLGTLTYQQVADSADIGVQQGNTFEFVVAVGANVDAADSQNPPQPTSFPEHLIFAHSLAHASCGDTGMCAVRRENSLRQEQGLPLRSTTIGHRNIDANGRDITLPFYNASVIVQSQPEFVTTTPSVIQTNITPRPLLPLPKKPNE